VRYRRYQALANAAGTLASGEEGSQSAGILARAIAGSVVKRAGASEGSIRIRAHWLPELENFSNLDALKRAAREDAGNVYEAQVLAGPDGVELLRKSATLEVAPVENTRSRKSGATGKSPAANPRPSQP